LTVTEFNPSSTQQLQRHAAKKTAASATGRLDVQMRRAPARCVTVGLFALRRSLPFGNTRADAVFGTYEISNEFKRDDNAELWTAWDHQISQYTMDPKLQKHAIYCVIWFGTANRRCPTGEMIKNANQLAAALATLIRTAGHDPTAIIVLDVS
jgi:hypothetical protein